MPAAEPCAAGPTSTPTRPGWPWPTSRNPCDWSRTRPMPSVAEGWRVSAWASGVRRSRTPRPVSARPGPPVPARPSRAASPTRPRPSTTVPGSTPRPSSSTRPRMSADRASAVTLYCRHRPGGLDLLDEALLRVPDRDVEEILKDPALRPLRVAPRRSPGIRKASALLESVPEGAGPGERGASAPCLSRAAAQPDRGLTPPARPFRTDS